MPLDAEYMRLCLRLARRGFGATSPNPMVGSLLLRAGKILGRGWHRQAGGPHAEIEALNDASRQGHKAAGATLYVTLEPCSTYGRTRPCTDAIVAAGIRRVVVGSVDPNPRHASRGLRILRQAGIKVQKGILTEECVRLNEAFNYWIQRRLPLVTVKAAMTLDGKIATPSGESKWITGEAARAHGMKLRLGADAIVVGINTILADNPSLTVRRLETQDRESKKKPLRRIVLDAAARTPLDAKVASDNFSAWTTVVVSRQAPTSRKQELSRRVRVLVAPSRAGRIDLRWLLKKLGSEDVTSVLVEGGGEVNASFLLGGLAHRIAFFYAPKILGGANARKAVAGAGAKSLKDALDLTDVKWRRLGVDWLLTARIRKAR
jgi:diaminohydroxyphosphoribosylaminopyrimidine deaminase/5-amino-6-(5-phosphoribosylamino)uracil reductase